MQIIKPDQLGLLFTSCRLLDELYASIGALAGFTLDSGTSQKLLTESGVWRVVAEALGDQEVLDMGLPKKRGEYLVYGACQSREPVQAREVEVGVGRAVKTLHVTGDRVWSAGEIPGAPKPFTAMPVSWAKAFGGANFPDNPKGIGLLPGPYGNVQVPNIQDPGHLITSPREKPEPAGFSALDPFGPQRTKYLGAFDDQWLKTRWPHFPQGTDPEFFNTAPLDQRRDGYFQGDEPLRVKNMNLERPEILSRLPGVRARIFLNRLEKGRLHFVEAPARPETLWLFPNQNAGLLLFRAVARVTDEELDDVVHLMADWELLSEAARPADFYEQKLEKILNPPPEISAEPEAAPPPQEPKPVEVETPASPPPETPAEPPPILAEMDQLMAKTQAQVEALFKELGTTKEEAMTRFLPKSQPAPVHSPEAVQDLLAQTNTQIDSLFKQMGLTREEALAKALPGPTLAPDPQVATAQAASFLKELEGFFTQMGLTPSEAVAKVFPGESGKVMDLGRMAADLEAAAAAFSQVQEEPPKHQAPTPEPPPMPEPPGPPTVEMVMDRYQKGQALSGLDLGGLDFSGRILKGADFKGSILARTRFSGADLSASDFSGALLADADFSGAIMEQAVLIQVQALEAKFSGARLSQADFRAGDFTKADFTGAILDQAVLSDASFAQASFVKVHGLGLQAERSTFAGADFTDADFQEATLTQSDFSGAVMDRFHCVQVRAMGIGLEGARGTGADFSGADLRNSQAGQGTTFSRTVFSRANLSRACWEKTLFSETLFIEARLEKADFSRSIFEKSNLVNAFARGANFMKAVLTDCDARGLDLFKGSLRQTRIKAGDFSNVHFFGADLYGTSMVDTETQGADFQRVLLIKKT